MNINLKILPKYAYLVSSLIASIIFFYFSYKAVVTYLIHKELYGDGMDVLVSLRAALAGVMLLLIVFFFQFIKIKDLNSQRTIQKGIFIGWAIIAIAMIIFIPSYIYFILITILSSIVSFLSSITLKHKITEDLKNKKETLSEKEIYLLQKLAGVKDPKK